MELIEDCPNKKPALYAYLPHTSLYPHISSTLHFCFYLHPPQYGPNHSVSPLLCFDYSVHVCVCVCARAHACALVGTLSCFSHVQLCATPWTVDLKAPLSMGFSRQEYWSGLPSPPPRDLPNPGIKPAFLMSPALASAFFTTSATREAP